ncbi:hypothetical protein C9890_0495 [Perkinsus sp. BL_2016]|nr:hypothetical protein C9890_0495 [Perkinsus sp. BL_2016]
MGPNGTSFHKFLGLRPLPPTVAQRGEEWNLSVDYCLSCMRNQKKKKNRQLKSVRVIILEEGIELHSNVLEAFFRYVKEIDWDVITIINGDPCQGNYREDKNDLPEVTFFAKTMLVAEICPNIELFTFTQDLRTKNSLLREAKFAVRNAKVTPEIFRYLQTLQYSRQETPVDVILCTHISDMNAHNAKLLAENPIGSITYYTAKPSTVDGQHPVLNYKHNGVEHRLQLKIGAPIIITHDVEVVTSRGAKFILKNGTAGKVVELLQFSIKVVVPILGKQIPVILAYAATIAKCIGFEFDNIAVDFGLQGKTETEIAMQGNANWRRKMAYTAITRAKQQVYAKWMIPVIPLQKKQRLMTLFSALEMSFR